MARAAQADTAAALPQSFALSDLSIDFSRQNGNAAFKPWRVQLSGAGSGSLTYEGQQWALTQNTKSAVALLNDLLEQRFFYMPAQYSSHPYAQLLADGSVRLVEKSMTDAQGSSLCVRIAAFEHCVRFGPKGPEMLDRLFQRVIADAMRQAGLPPSAK